MVFQVFKQINMLNIQKRVGLITLKYHNNNAAEAVLTLLEHSSLSVSNVYLCYGGPQISDRYRYSGQSYETRYSFR